MFRKYLALERSKTSLLSKKGISTSSDNEQGVQVDDRSSTDSNQQPSSNGDDVGKSIEKTQSTGDETGSENAVTDWASIVRKLTSDTDKVLNTLRETEWKETGGTFTEEVIGGLDLLQTNYFVLYDQKAPIEYVEQSRKEIAKAIFEANIIPNICGVLTDLYVQNLALSASHKYDVVTNNAIIIINNYAKYDNTEEYTKAIAICPGFLEFLREQFASSSAKYLQLHEQGTLLDGRLLGFIRIVNKISTADANVLRLRTLNFTDALKRYLTAPNNIIRQFALSILAIIFIEEATPVFESDETSSQDLSKSRNATRNWQKVVTKLTELFAKEVDNMNGTVWKGEDGTYKKHVLSFLRLAQEIHFELGKHNAPLEYVRQSAKDFARVLVDANIAPKICDVMVDLNQNIPVITDNEEHELISRFARAVLVSNTDCSVDFAEQVVNVPGFLEFLRDKLSLASEEHLQLHKQNSPELDAILTGFTYIVLNISMFDSCLTRLRNIHITEALQPYLRSTNSEIQLPTLAALAGIIDEKESEMINSNEESVFNLIRKLRNGLKTKHRTSAGWQCYECARTIKNLARNDANKKLLVHLGALELLVELTGGGEDEQIEAVQALWALSFDEDNRTKMVQDETLELVSALDKLKDSENKMISKAAYGTLWNLRDLLQNLKLEKYRNIVKSIMVAENNRSLSSVSSEMKREGHIMISYQWSHQKTLLMVREELARNGFKVWMDVEQMMGSIAQAMAEAVENADIVLICLSHKYKNSEPCRQEVEYANLLKKKIVPLQLEERYRPDGWLGIIARRLKYYDFSGHRPIKSEMNDLLVALKKMKEEVHSDLSENAIQLKTPDFADGQRSHGSVAVPYITKKSNTVRQWTDEDVEAWMNTNKLPRDTFANLTAKGIALLLRMRTEAPEAFYRYVQEIWTSDPDIVSNLVWALDSIER